MDILFNTPDIESEQNAFHRDGLPPRSHFLALQTRFERVLHQLDQTCHLIASLEEELDLFLRDYYAAIGSKFEELAKLEHEVRGMDEPEIASSSTPFLPAPTRMNATDHRHAIQTQIKLLYRSLVKECHPDIALHQSKNSRSQELMRTINDAYASRNVSELWQAKWQMECYKYGDDKTAALPVLQDYLDMASAQLCQLQERKRDIEQSASYALMQRALQLRLCGQDFIEIVRQNVQQHIEVTRRRMVIAKIKYNSTRFHQLNEQPELA